MNESYLFNRVALTTIHDAKQQRFHPTLRVFSVVPNQDQHCDTLRKPQTELESNARASYYRLHKLLKSGEFLEVTTGKY